ncbi:hypothetical protein J6590_055496 [Homalodisca vitripennis]|nr:hypothetical protein J6590_055496 [Homalodisca vitripennis]
MSVIWQFVDKMNTACEGNCSDNRSVSPSSVVISASSRIPTGPHARTSHEKKVVLGRYLSLARPRCTEQQAVHMSLCSFVPPIPRSTKNCRRKTAIVFTLLGRPPSDWPYLPGTLAEISYLPD